MFLRYSKLIVSMSKKKYNFLSPHAYNIRGHFKKLLLFCTSLNSFFKHL